MGTGLFELYRQNRFRIIPYLFYSFLFLSACATASTPNRTTSSIDIKPEALNIQTELSSHEVVSGTLALVKLNLPEDLRKKQVIGEFEGNELPFYETNQGLEAVLSVPYEHAPGPGSILVKIGEGADTKQFQVPFKVIEGNYRSEVLHVDSRRVNPKATDLLRIREEQAEVQEIYKKVTRQKYWKGPFIFPIQSRVTSPFGSKRVFNGQLKNFHPGLDLKAAVGTPIRAAAPGVVVMAKSLFYTGNTVMVDHGYGMITLYAHMSKIQVKLGQQVKGNELLGLSGKTGRVNGPHLHWQAVVHRVKVDPMGLIQVIR